MRPLSADSWLPALARALFDVEGIEPWLPPSARARARWRINELIAESKDVLVAAIEPWLMSFFGALLWLDDEPASDAARPVTLVAATSWTRGMDWHGERPAGHSSSLEYAVRRALAVTLASLDLNIVPRFRVQHVFLDRAVYVRLVPRKHGARGAGCAGGEGRGDRPRVERQAVVG